MRSNVAYRHFAKAIFSATILTAVGCASSGGSSTPPSPPATITPPAPDPTPPPPDPTPDPPVNFDTTEFQNQSALSQINALPAYDAGAQGQDTIVAIIDTGIDLNNPEFEDRIHPASADLVVAGITFGGDARAPSLQDEDDHGTPIASIIGAERDDVAIHGVAPETELLIFRADDDGPEEEIILGSALLEGVIRAGAIGADALNLSLGSNEPTARDDFQGLLVRTKNSDIVTAIAAGNGGGSQPDLSALSALDVPGAPATIVVGAVNSNNMLAGFSNAAGDAAEVFLVAPGNGISTVRVDTPTGSTDLFSGTSASTPHVTGAVALVRSIWPALTAEETVEILLDSATDLGAPGTDPIFGRGLLNVGAAVSPIGGVTTSSIDGTITSTNEISATLSPVFGAGFTDIEPIIVVDRFNRDFRADFDGFINAAAPDQFNLEAKFSPFYSAQFANQRINAGTALTLQLTQENRAYTDADANLFARFSGADPQTENEDTRLAFALTHALNEKQSITLAQGLSPRTLDSLSSPSANPFIGEHGFRDLYLSQSNDAFAAGTKISLGEKLTADVFISHADQADQNINGLFDPVALEPAQSISNARIGLTRRTNGLALRFEQGLRQESGAILGADFGAGSSASTFYSAVDADWRANRFWRFSARYAAGYTFADTNGFGGFVDGFSNIVTSQFSLGVERRALFQNADQLNFAISQPLRAQAGVARLILPTDFNKETESILFETQLAPLAQTGRALDFEARYRFATGELGHLDLHLLHQVFGQEGFSAQATALVRTGFDF